MSSIEMGDADSEGWSVNLSDTDQRTMSTAEIVRAFKSGSITDDAYVWRDGMPDWRPLLEVPELRSAIDAARGVSAKDGKRAEAARVSASTAARVAGGRTRGGADLFGAGRIEEEAPHADASSSISPDNKPTGARNENSVLFSLDALKAGFAAPAPPPRRQTLQQDFTVSNEDPFGMSKGNSDLNGMAAGNNALFAFDNQALLSAPAVAAAREPEPVRAPAGAQLAPLGSPAASQARSKAALAIGAVLALLIVIGIGALFARSGSKNTNSAQTEPKSEGTPAAGNVLKNTELAAALTVPNGADNKPAPAATAAAQTPASQSAAQVANPADSAKAPNPAATGNTAEGTAALAQAQAAAAKPHPTDDAKKHAAEPQTKPEPKKGKAEEKAQPAAVDAPAFNKGAAVAALSSAAAGAASCKRGGGPTGSGKVLITFAPSGRVTTANVSGGSFGGTSVGGCVASVFRAAKIPAFSGGPVTVSKSFVIP